MSRLGKIPVSVPQGVKINVSNGTAQIEGPKGKVSLPIPQGITVEFKDQQLKIGRNGDTKQTRSNHGSVRAHLVNIIEGVTKGHKEDLEIQGVGFRAQLQGSKIVFSIGLSHPMEYELPKDVKANVPTQTSISIEGIDKQLVGQVAANIRALKPAEPYKGKGIRYVGEVVRRKQGKAVAKS